MYNLLILNRFKKTSSVDSRKMFFLFADTQQIVHNCDVIKKITIFE